MKQIIISGYGIDALVANYVLADLGYSPIIVTPHPNAQSTMFANGPWRHTGSSPLLAQMLEDLGMDFESYSLSVSLDGEDWTARQAKRLLRKSTHTIFDRFPDIKRILGGDSHGYAFDREQLVFELRANASLPESAHRGRLHSATDVDVLIDTSGLEQGRYGIRYFDHLIVTDVTTLARLDRSGKPIEFGEQLIYKIEGASFADKRFDSKYYSEGEIVRVTTCGNITYVQTRGGLTPEALAAFGGKLTGHESIIRGPDVESAKPLALNLAPTVHALGSAATSVDQTISDVMEIAHNWGLQWK